MRPAARGGNFASEILSALQVRVFALKKYHASTWSFFVNIKNKNF